MSLDGYSFEKPQVVFWDIAHATEMMKHAKCDRYVDCLMRSTQTKLADLRETKQDDRATMNKIDKYECDIKQHAQIVLNARRNGCANERSEEFLMWCIFGSKCLFKQFEKKQYSIQVGYRVSTQDLIIRQFYKNCTIWYIKDGEEIRGMWVAPPMAIPPYHILCGDWKE